MPSDWTNISSLQNGLIEFRLSAGQPEVYVDGYGQSDDYARQLWRSALHQLPPAFQASQILMLGLAGGVAINELYDRFPNCKIIIIEWDPSMVLLFNRYCQPHLPITIIEGDAVLAVPQLPQSFDLILVDLFTGGLPEPRLLDDSFVAAIASHLTPSGFCLLNAFETAAFFTTFSRHLSPFATWRFDYNLLAAYSLSLADNKAK